MMQNKDQSRLLIATFIVATSIAVFFSDAKINVEPSSGWGYVVGVALFSLLISSALSFLYIICKGYELRHKEPGANNFIDKKNYLLFDWSIKSYPWIIGFLSFSVLYKFLQESSETGQLLSTALVWVVAVLFIVLINKRQAMEIVEGVKVICRRK